MRMVFKFVSESSIERVAEGCYAGEDTVLVQWPRHDTAAPPDASR